VSRSVPKKPEVRAGLLYSVLLLLGLGTRSAHAQAISLLAQCDSGRAHSCFELGIRYDRGEGVREDVARAAIFYQKACDDGLADGCYLVGAAYATERPRATSERPRSSNGRAKAGTLLRA